MGQLENASLLSFNLWNSVNMTGWENFLDCTIFDLVNPQRSEEE